MCLILLALGVHPKYKLVLAANRDEFYARPTSAAGFWDDAANVLAGRDLALGGTWLGVTKGGRFAAVTNYRDPQQPKGRASRGNLTSDYLRGEKTVSEYLQEIEGQQEKYTGFNLLLGQFGAPDDEMAYFSNRGAGVKLLKPGVYGISNALIDTPWPKVTRGKDRFEKIIESGNEISPSVLFELLQDRSTANDEDLPDTGIGIEYERVLSSMFIDTPIYGTRSSSVVLIDNEDFLSFSEISHQPAGQKISESFRIKKGQTPDRSS